MPDWFEDWVECHLEPMLAKLRELIEAALQPPGARGEARHGVFLFLASDGRLEVSDFTLRDDNTAGGVGSIALLDTDGQPTTADSPPAWANSDDTVLTVVPAADGLSAQINVASPPKEGESTITITVTDSDSTTFEITAVGQVTAGEAKSGSFSFAAS